MPTKLYSVNVDVDKINKKEFDELVEKGAMVKNYKTKYSSHPSAESWAQSLKIPDQVDLCIGAQVLVTWNLQNESSIVNGTRGIITDFCLEGPKIKLVDGKEIIIEYMKLSCEDNEKITVTFIPLKLAYAISIHKSQGMTLDAMEIDLGTSIFEYGQAYTALSRAKSLDNIKIISVKSKSFMTHSKVKDFYKVKIT
jgi:ATP-dependent exoDNAse (exonuclease V) alpha subunit